MNKTLKISIQLHQIVGSQDHLLYLILGVPHPQKINQLLKIISLIDFSKP